MRWIARALALAWLALLGALNGRLYAPIAAAAPQPPPDAQAQLANIGRRLRAGEGARMQQLFPEGHFFSHVLYGMAWVNLGLASEDRAFRQRAADEAGWALLQVQSPEGIAPFVADTQVPNGVFYLGWTNRLRGGWLKLNPAASHGPREQARFRADSAALARAFATHRLPNLEAYPGQTWPCDNVMALASLALADELLGTTYRADVIAPWVAAMRARLDPATGLIAHRVSAADGRMTDAPRGSSQVYILTVLPELDAMFAREQYARFRASFVMPVLGFLPVREYPFGVEGSADVDSGPIVFAIGPSATVTGIAAARVNGDLDLAERTIALSEAFGGAYSVNGERAFGFGQIIVADAFLAWGKSALPWSGPMPAPAQLPPPTWRLLPHAASLVLALPAVVFLVRGWARRRK